MTDTIPSPPFAWLGFNPDGTESSRFLPGESGLTSSDHRAAGRIPVRLPSGYPYVELISAQQSPEGKVSLTWPDHLRDWTQFWAVIREDSMYSEVVIAARSSPALNMSVTVFALALTALKNDGATAEEFLSLQNVWELLKAD
ncbi:MAG: hypothetical protein AAGA67_14285, partial [Cyanobacteria bacterium P01_F01_bin.153]